MRQDEQIRNILSLRDRANEVRAVASSVSDKECHALLGRLADSYESMVEASQRAYLTGHGLKY